MKTNKFPAMVKGLSLASCLWALTGRTAWAHAADQGFVLLLPTTAYITGGTVAVAVTILLLLVLRPGQLERFFTPLTLPLSARAVSPPAWVGVAASLVLLGLIWIGLRGPTDPQANLLPLTLWTLWWMLLFSVQGLIFDVWKWVTPWPGLHRLLLRDHRAPLRLPAALSVWPAVLLMLAFQGYVLADPAPNDPRRLAGFALGYWAFTFAGMTLFGRGPWLRQVECFSVLFDLLGRLRIFGGDDRVQIGVPGWQMRGGSDLSHAAFVLVLLAAGSFDGLHETFWWLAQLGVNPLEYPGRTAMMPSTVAGLYGGIVLLAVVFAVSVRIGTGLAGRGGQPFGAVFVAFAMTLLPIALGYHIAHYLVTFLVQIQVVAATLGDPLAAGWNIVGLAQTRVKVGFLTVPATVKLIWLTQAGVVVLSHVIAVVLCHRTAEKLCDTRAGTMKIQLAISVLMIFYTVFGLWLLAVPRGV